MIWEARRSCDLIIMTDLYDACPWYINWTLNSLFLSAWKRFNVTMSVKSNNNDKFLYLWMLSSKCYSQTIRIYGIGLMFPWRVTNMAQTMAKNDKIILPLQHWGPRWCLPHRHMISVHLWNRLSAFILKYLMQNLKNSVVAKRNGPSMVRPWVAQWIHRSHLAPRRPRFSSTGHTNYASTSVC